METTLVSERRRDVSRGEVDLAAAAGPIVVLEGVAAIESPSRMSDVAIRLTLTAATVRTASQGDASDHRAAGLEAFATPTHALVVLVPLGGGAIDLPAGYAQQLAALPRLRFMSRPADSTVYACGDVELDCDERVARVNGRRQTLTFGEFEVLLRLIQRKGHTLTRQQLVPASPRAANCSLRSIDVHVLRIRRKLADAQRFAIKTVKQLGYRCVEPPGCQV